MELSLLKFHSWGKVAINKPFGTKEIMVVPVEYRFGLDEAVIDNPTREEISYETDDGEDQIVVVQNSTIPATWLKFNSNRVTAPDVRRNDDVLIWRLGNTDKYFWTDFNTANVKRLETIVWVFSADPKNPVADDLSNAYFLEVSTHNKSITLKTSQANGEPFGYTFQLNTDEGMFTILDTDDNTVYLNSAETIIGFKNAKGTELRLDKKDIFGYAPDSVYWEAVNTMSFKCKDYKVIATNSITAKTNSYTMESPKTKFTGDVDIGGKLDVKGKTTLTELEADKATFKSHGPH